MCLENLCKKKKEENRETDERGPKAKANRGIPKSPSKGAEQKAKGQRQMK